jgi:hypothetical protein
MKQLITLIGMSILTLSASGATEKLLDFYDEAIRLFGVSTGNRNIDANLKQRLDSHYYFNPAERFTTPGFDYDFSDKISGDFSVTYTPKLSSHAARFGFMTQLWGNYFELNDTFDLTFYMKVLDNNAADTWQVSVLDSNNRVATATLGGANTKGQWKAFSIPLEELHKPANFDINRIKLIQFESVVFSDDAVIKFDKIGFSSETQFLGITDKTIEQRMREAEATRQIRTTLVMENLATRAPRHFPLMRAFALLYLNKELDAANTLLLEGLDQALAMHHWDLFENTMICRLYYYFSKSAGKFKGRMSAEAERKLLEVLWERTHVKNDIHWAHQSVWYLDGSENHDLSAKVANLVSSRIFMNEPDYRDRIYPNYGYGGGYYYGHAGYLGEDPEPSRVSESGGRANLSDGKKYTATDHYAAWLSFFKEYFSERAKHGFFVENFSHNYSAHTWNMITLAKEFGGDEDLRKLLTDFADLYWAAWVQAAPSGILGGPKTRHHATTGGYDSNTGMISTKLGGVGRANVWMYWNEISNYTLPKIIWKMALDREGMGNFVYKSRGIGEEVNQLPRPAGTERSLVIEPNSRLLKYVYVTPRYTLGTQMDHPLAVHSHLSKAGRWHGMTLAQDAEARIVPVGLVIDDGNPEGNHSISMEVMYKSAQYKNTLIIQRSRNYTVLDPDWFPLRTNQSNMQGIYIGTKWSRVEERGGWIFLRKGDVFAAIRPVLRDASYEIDKAKRLHPERTNFIQRPHEDATVRLTQNAYLWNKDNSILVLKDKFTPVIIQSGDIQTYGSFDNFIRSVKDARLQLYKTVVPEYDELVYTPPGKGAPEMIFNAANMEIPRIGGESINYEFPMTFDSPYIKSKYGTGVIYIEYGGETLTIDFSENNKGHYGARPD